MRSSSRGAIGRVLFLACAVMGLLTLAAPARADRTINSVVLTYSTQVNTTSVTVPAGATIEATLNVTRTTAGTGERWRSTGWRFASSGAFTCDNHTNIDTAGTSSFSFNITAPAVAGIYNLQFVAYDDNTCSGGASVVFTLTGAARVGPSATNSLVAANPTTVFADGVSTSVITVTLRDAANNAVAGKTVVLTPGSGTSTISAASGPSNGSGVVTFTVRNTVVESVTYTATDTTDGITFTDTATVAFGGGTVNRFNAVERGANPVFGTIFTKVAGRDFALDIVIITPGNALVTTFTGQVAVEIVDNSSGGACGALPVIATLANQTFAKTDLGRHALTAGNTVTNAYPNAKVRVKSPAVGPTTISCSTDNFAIRPDAFTGFNVSHADPQSPGGTPLANVTLTAGEVHKAGRPFTVSATAASATGAATANYAGTPRADAATCSTGPACTPTVGTFTVGAPFGAGQLASTAGTYNEVGAFAVQLVDDTFASVDLGDGSTAADRNIVSPVISVGRFIPDRFDIALNTPQLGTACAAGGFTYIGQPFSYTTQPVITVTAKGFGGNTTTLYTREWWRITSASITPASQAARYSAATGTLDTGGLPAISDPEIFDAGGGVGTLTFKSGGGLAFVRTTPASSPFSAEVSLAVNVIDADGAAYPANPARFGATAPGGGIAFSAGSEMRFGRVRLSNAHGSQLIGMPIPLQLQYWNGTVFVPHAADTCTTLTAANVALGNWKNMTAGAASVATVSAFTGGNATLRLAAPGGTAPGSVDVAINLSGATAGAACAAPPPSTPLAASTPANKTYLQGAWCGAGYTNDPRARATFGVYRGSDRVIYQRENY